MKKVACITTASATTTQAVGDLYVGYIMSGKAKFSVAGQEVSINADDIDSADLGLTLGVEYQLPQGLFFELGYGFGLANLYKDSGSVKAHNRVFQLGVGYKF